MNKLPNHYKGLSVDQDDDTTKTLDKLTRTEKRSIKRLAAKKKPLKDIAERIGCTVGVVKAAIAEQIDLLEN